MEELEEILRLHAEKYPKMMPQDCAKLLYQSEFGGDHMIRSAADSLQWLKAEYELTPADETAELSVPIGNYLCRINLAKAKTLYTPEQVNEWFVQTANACHGSFSEYFDQIRYLSKRIELFSFTAEQYQEFMAYYRSQGYPAVHHSKQYNAAYAPHYRVIYQGMWNHQ